MGPLVIPPVSIQLAHAVTILLVGGCSDESVSSSHRLAFVYSSFGADQSRSPQFHYTTTLQPLIAHLGRFAAATRLIVFLESSDVPAMLHLQVVDPLSLSLVEAT